MNRINEFNVEPGTYADANGNVYVVIDMITNMYALAGDIPERLTDPVVIIRPLVNSLTVHERTGFPLSVFQQKFVKA